MLRCLDATKREAELLQLSRNQTDQYIHRSEAVFLKCAQNSSPSIPTIQNKVVLCAVRLSVFTFCCDWAK